MAVDFKRLKQINPRQSLTVYGYIRNVQKVLPAGISYYNIHDLIKQTCILFYAFIHEWDKELIGERVEFIEETNSIKQIALNRSSSTYLKDIFDSDVHHWKFKIEKITDPDDWYCTLGISKMKSADFKTNCAFTYASKQGGYGYAYSIARKTNKRGHAFVSDDENKYGVKARSGDIIEMHCDMNKLELSFSVNGIDQGVAYENMEKTKYKAAINLYCEGDMVSLLE